MSQYTLDLTQFSDGDDLAVEGIFDRPSGTDALIKGSDSVGDFIKGETPNSTYTLVTSLVPVTTDVLEVYLEIGTSLNWGGASQDMAMAWHSTEQSWGGVGYGDQTKLYGDWGTGEGSATLSEPPPPVSILVQWDKTNGTAKVWGWQSDVAQPSSPQIDEVVTISAPDMRGGIFAAHKGNPIYAFGVGTDGDPAPQVAGQTSPTTKINTIGWRVASGDSANDVQILEAGTSTEIARVSVTTSNPPVDDEGNPFDGGYEHDTEAGTEYEIRGVNTDESPEVFGPKSNVLTGWTSS